MAFAKNPCLFAETRVRTLDTLDDCVADTEALETLTSIPEWAVPRSLNGP